MFITFFFNFNGFQVKNLKSFINFVKLTQLCTNFVLVKQHNFTRLLYLLSISKIKHHHELFCCVLSSCAYVLNCSYNLYSYTCSLLSHVHVSCAPSNLASTSFGSYRCHIRKSKKMFLNYWQANLFQWR